ncbi:HAMP domain-containing protein [Micromonosporaceae bacterium Da 78-11]
MRAQLTLAVTAVAVLVVALAGLLIVLRVDRLESRNLDHALATRLDEISAAATRSGSLPTDNAYAVRLIQDGKVRAKAGPDTTFPLPAETGYATVTVADRQWRSLTRVLVTGAELQVLRSLDDAESTHTGVVRVVDLAILLAALLGAAAAWYLAGLGLRPLRRLRDSVLELRPDDSGPRVPEVAGPPEVADLAGTINAALDRLRTSTATAQRFTTGAEHDLRPPLAELGSGLERLLSDPDLPATQRHLILAAMAEEHDRMVTLLDEMHRS